MLAQVDVAQVSAALHDAGALPALVIAGCYFHFVLRIRPMIVRGLAILEALRAKQLSPAELEEGQREAEREVPDVGAVGSIVERIAQAKNAS